MIRKVLSILFLSAMLLLSGCGDSSDDGESLLEAQQLLDNGDHDAAIALLETLDGSNSVYLLLASAYVDRAGLSLSDLVDIVINSSDVEGDAFASFVDSVSDRRSASALTDLEESTLYYTLVVGSACSDSAADANLTLSDSQKDVCLFMGLAETMKAATTISYIADDVSVLAGDSNVTDYKLEASACAMKYAFDGNVSGLDCTITDNNSSVYFMESNRTYNQIFIDVNGTSEQYEYLLTDANSTAITDGYCTPETFSTRVSDKNATDYNSSTYYVCPVNEDPNAADITIEEVLVDALNNGIDSILVAATEDMQSDIDEFKCEVLGGTYNEFTLPTCSDDLGNSIDLATDVTVDDLVNYLNDNNL